MGIKSPTPEKGKNITPTVDNFPKSIFNYPVFCLKHLHRDYSLSQCDKDDKNALIDRLHKLSSMTWEQIRTSPRHGLGQEMIKRNAIKASIPSHITPDVNFYALRFNGKKPMVGYKTDFIFHIVYLDRDFTLYDHG